MILETERLLLRPWEESDAEECYKYAKDPSVGPAAGWPAHTDVENSRQVIRDILSAPETYAIVLRETGLPVGNIGLHRNDVAEKPDEMELGYWLGVPYWGRGIVPEAAREVLRHAFEDLGLARVWCCYYDGNGRSRRVQEKLGFRHRWTNDSVPVPRMGETRKGHVNLLTKEEWVEGQNMTDLNGIFQSVLEADRAAVVICDTDHRIVYMNPAAIERYRKWGGEALLGKSLLDCHNAASRERIGQVLDWFRRSKDNNIVYTSFNRKENKDVYMVALRDGAGDLIGYYEKHEYRDRETMKMYDLE